MPTIYRDKNISLATNQLELLKNYHIISGNLADELITHAGNIDILLIHSKLPNEVLSALRDGIFIGVRAHNTDYVDVELAKSKGITVKGIPAVGQNAVAEHIIALIFAMSKQITRADRDVRGGNWQKNLTLNTEIYGKTISIIGGGDIGTRLQKLCKSLGMNTLVINRDNIARLPDYLGISDYVSLNINGRKENFHFFDESKIKMMKSGSILVNTARGSILDTKALVRYLQNGHLGGAALDVYEEEPYIPDELAVMGNVVLTPHVAYKTAETLNKMNDELVKLIL